MEYLDTPEKGSQYKLYFYADLEELLGLWSYPETIEVLSKV